MASSAMPANVSAETVAEPFTTNNTVAKAKMGTRSISASPVRGDVQNIQGDSLTNANQVRSVAEMDAAGRDGSVARMSCATRQRPFLQHSVGASPPLSRLLARSLYTQLATWKFLSLARMTRLLHQATPVRLAAVKEQFPLKLRQGKLQA